MQPTLSRSDPFFVFGRAAKKPQLGFRSRFVPAKVGHEIGWRLADTLQATLPPSWKSLSEEAAVRVEYPYTLQLRAGEYEVLEASCAADASSGRPADQQRSRCRVNARGSLWHRLPQQRTSDGGRAGLFQPALCEADAAGRRQSPILPRQQGFDLSPLTNGSGCLEENSDTRSGERKSGPSGQQKRRSSIRGCRPHRAEMGVYRRIPTTLARLTHAMPGANKRGRTQRREAPTEGSCEKSFDGAVVPE